MEHKIPYGDLVLQILQRHCGKSRCDMDYQLNRRKAPHQIKVSAKFQKN